MEDCEGKSLAAANTPNCLPMKNSLFPLRKLLTLAAFATASSAMVPYTHAADAAWGVTTGGNWTTNGNWTPSGFPGATSGTTNQDTATFNRSTIAASSNVTLDSAINIKNITIFNDTSVGGINYTVSGNATNNLSLSDGGKILVTGNATSANAPVILAPVRMNGNYTLEVNNVSGGNSSLNIGNANGGANFDTAANLGNVTLTIHGNSTGFFNSRIWHNLNQTTGTTLAVEKTGSMAWVLSGTGSNFTGGLFIKEGAVSAALSTSLGLGLVTLGDSTLGKNAELNLGGNVNIANDISVASGAGLRLIWRGSNTGTTSSTGNITLNNKEVTIDQARTGTFTIGNATVGARQISGTGDVILRNTGAGSLVVTANITATGSILNNGTSTGSSTISGAIGSNVTGVTQNSATSNLTLSNAGNAYTGNTTISAGTLLLTGAGTLGNSNLVLKGGTLNITGTTTGFTMSSSQSISGNGSIITTGKTFTLNGALSPGNSPGIVNVTGDFTLGSTAVVNFEINGTTSTLFDQLLASGVLTYGGTLNLATGYAAVLNDSVKLFNGSSYNGTFSSITGTDLGGGLSWDTSALATTGTITVVPEPATWGLLGLGLGTLVLARRRKNS